MVVHQPVLVRPVPETPRFPFIADDVIETLGVQPESDLDDLSAVLCMDRMMAPKRQARAAALMQNDCFQSWLKSPDSQMLAVNGMGYDARPYTALSYFAALLRQTLSQLDVAGDKQVMTLIFFCGEHLESGDELKGPVGLMRSLCAQFLLAFSEQLDLAFIDHGFSTSLHSRHVDALCALFRELLASAARAVGRCVFICIIDKVCSFEDESNLADLDRVMACLRSIASVEPQDGFIVFKMLAMSGVASMNAGRWFGAEGILSMEDEVHNGGEEYGEFHMLSDSADLIGTS